MRDIYGYEMRDRDIYGYDMHLAQKKESKEHHKRIGAYVAGGMTLAAAAVGAAYLLQKRQESKVRNEDLLRGDYVPAQTI